MKAPVRPEGGFAWEQPGFKFYTDEARAWLGGYEPVGLGGDASSNYETAARAITDTMRAGGLEEIDRGRGTMPHLGSRSNAERDHNDAIRVGSI